MDTFAMRQSSHATASFSGHQLPCALPFATPAACRCHVGRRRLDHSHSKKDRLVARAATTENVVKKEQYNRSMGE